MPLAGTKGKSFSKGGIAPSVAGVRRAAEATSFTLVLSGDLGDRRFAAAPAIPLGEYRPPYRVEDHVQVQDDRGRAVSVEPGPLENREGGDVGIVVTVFAGRGSGSAPRRQSSTTT